MIIKTYHDKGSIGPAEAKELILQSLDMDKAEDIVCISLSDSTGLADYMVIASGTSTRHVNALAKKLEERLNIKGLRGIKTEGLSQCDWVVMDAGDVIVHLFRPEVRSFYNIEKMWASPNPAHLDIVGDQVQA